MNEMSRKHMRANAHAYKKKNLRNQKKNSWRFNTIKKKNMIFTNRFSAIIRHHRLHINGVNNCKNMSSSGDLQNFASLGKKIVGAAYNFAYVYSNLLPSKFKKIKCFLIAMDQMQLSIRKNQFYF